MRVDVEGCVEIGVSEDCLCCFDRLADLGQESCVCVPERVPTDNWQIQFAALWL